MEDLAKVLAEMYAFDEVLQRDRVLERYFDAYLKLETLTRGGVSPRIVRWLDM